MKEIEYLKGDATLPVTSTNKIIVHVCNDIGAWGRGFVLAISKRWAEPEKQYRELAKLKTGLEMGQVQFIQVENDIVVCNMIAQHGIKRKSTDVPIRYDELRKCLALVADRVDDGDSTVHMPRIGCNLAGGTWEKVEEIIIETLCKRDIQVFVYDL